MDKTNSLPKISIVTPSFNQGKFIEQTIRSVLNQNYPNLEYIIIDGGSTDNTVDIIKKYEGRIAYWVSERDEGQTHAINKGFKMATGDLVGWMNSDDIYYKGAFETISKSYLKTKGSYDVYFGNKKNITEDDRTLHEFYYSPFFKYTLFYDDMNISNQSAFWKRTVFNKIGYLNEELGFIMDYEFFLRMARASLKFFFIDEFIGALRHHEETKTASEEWQRKKALETELIKLQYNLKPNMYFKLLSKSYRTANLLYRGKFAYICKGAYRSVKNSL